MHIFAGPSGKAVRQYFPYVSSESDLQRYKAITFHKNSSNQNETRASSSLSQVANSDSTKTKVNNNKLCHKNTRITIKFKLRILSVTHWYKLIAWCMKYSLHTFRHLNFILWIQLKLFGLTICWTINETNLLNNTQWSHSPCKWIIKMFSVCFLLILSLQDNGSAKYFQGTRTGTNMGTAVAQVKSWF